MRKIRDCADNEHKRRDNAYGITWCVWCGRLFSKPSGKELKSEDIVKINTATNK